LYYLPDTKDGAFWNNTYDGVLRASTSAAPSDSPAESYGDYTYNSILGPGAVPAGPSSTEAASPSASSISTAFSLGLTQNGLVEGGNLGVDLTGSTLGAIVHVRSLAASIPSYELVDVLVGGGVKAVALMLDSPNGYSFGAIAPVSSEPSIMSAAGRDALMASNGMTGAGDLVWAPSTDGATPFAPFLEGVNASSGVTTYLTNSGPATSLKLVGGL
jgi:hypothetical protein